MSLVVRRVGPESAADVLAVVREAFGARPALDPPADALGEDVDSLRRLLARRGGLLACLDGEPVGCVVLDPGPDGLVLRRFGVTPAAQGRGVATALVEAAVEASAGRSAVRVVAREELPGTVAFWEAHDFVVTGGASPYVELARWLGTSFDAPDAETMRRLGARVGASLVAGDLVVLTGELGAGKTTFTQGLGEGLGVRGGVTSPTFVIARVHPALGEGPDLVHVDAYRLGGLDELDDLDLDTSLDTAVTVVEWGAGLAEGLAESRLEVVIERTVGDAPADDGADPRRVSLRWIVGQ
ncbi:tRNA (adenosine(37)-N6)-threonylcarbamoyltransferase complex ATPase subunit type 1 TsaE [Nocardioides sp. zg-1228]|uniref:tRNA (adenosine(37)-N6)-threonylcarbamoyltransferase complex ATPase subunit type 1 TsaE n=1 Tax=Nocardioides sp. zg-1228 TaxID=2763008 RepID=UPI0016428E67|nr:tRNA (adenosine(37)-N6)-threonylcarbamoyltransferase complex ATPase subunit type 1 TsaE [Nocardioides sp. zg-1228]MBC2934798.1 tRNA (adenosine(37)-N6)-threonylcarbamoyltransferase complex ATPase subunit type 1 TsaE [Nocardioides sp. zg-1228]QSF58411.1 tRNA (adenosine(37)-N6)-threonylcarbamoyltransferase complex ATPase subunit type 1 TsaE [Nocardioides sp. zg-1228]